MNDYKVKKRSGETVSFDISKVTTAIKKAFKETNEYKGEISIAELGLMALMIAEKKIKDGCVTVEEIQDSVEEALMRQGFVQTAKSYILYRKNREKIRNLKSMLNYKDLVESYVKSEDWRVKENSTVNYSVGGLILSNSGSVTANYWLNEVYDEEIAEAHKSAEIHIHDLSMLTGYCAGWSLKQLIQEGLGRVPGKISSAPASHLSTLCNQMVNFLGILQNEWAGAQAFSSFDTYLAPFVKEDKLDYKGVKQALQSFIYGVNTPSRWGCQAPFTNITLDWTVPPDLKDEPAIVGGKLLDYTYGDCQTEMDLVNKAFLNLMLEGDYQGRGFQYPIPTYSITKDFDWSENKENNQLLFEMTAKYGTPYFSNYVNSEMDPSDVRSMCPLTSDTKILVRSSRGICVREIGDIYNSSTCGAEYEVWTGKKWAKGRPNQVPMTRIIRVTLSNGQVIKFGENHLQPTQTRGTVKAAELKVGDYLPFNKNAIESDIGQFDEDEDFHYFKVIKIEEMEDNSSQFLYCFEVDDNSHLFMLANGTITHNCRLQLDLRELRRKSGGFFGSGESTGSIGVVTIGLPRIAFLSNSKEEFFERLEKLMDISARSLKMKRNEIEKYLENGLYPFTKRYLGSFKNHFSTIGIVGMNEACFNAKWIGRSLISEEAQNFAIEVLTFMKNKLSDYQEQYGDLYNLEATPAESTAFRLAMHDRKYYPGITVASEEGVPYYTNSSHLPVGYTEDIFSALDIQDKLQTLYTSGTVFHGFVGEKLPTWQSAAKLVRKVAENYKLPYFTLSPTYSICKTHGYLVGEQYECPKCGEKTEVYSRITGYYRPVQNWNDGKIHEFADRKEYKGDFLNGKN